MSNENTRSRLPVTDLLSIDFPGNPVFGQIGNIHRGRGRISSGASYSTNMSGGSNEASVTWTRFSSAVRKGTVEQYVIGLPRVFQRPA
jgi:hypothetical protein